MKIQNTLSFLYAVVGVATPLLAAGTTNLVTKPNVIFIMTDDQGSVDLGSYGSKDIETPATDSLAASGVRFTQFYAAAAVCSPSRAAMLTGRYPIRTGLEGNASSQAEGGRGLSSSEKTMAEMFKAAGYATAQIGKWHLGYQKEQQPNAQGFDYSFGHLGGCIDNYSHYYYWGGPNRHDLYRNGVEVYYPGEFFPDLMVREAVQFIEQQRRHPFFLYFALNTPHYPYQAEPRWIEHFKHLPYPRNLYAAFLASQNERLAALLRRVDELGLRERTIIVFQSDNGHSTEDRAHGGGGSAGRYRGAKFSLFEGGIRVPAIISWPGKLPRGEARAQTAHACDWLPTLAELCEVPLLNTNLDGKSLASVIRSAEAAGPHPVLHWQTGKGAAATWAVREANWKLISHAVDTSAPADVREPVPLFLADLSRDVGEQTNLVAEYPEIVKRLQALHDDWEASVRTSEPHP